MNQPDTTTPQDIIFDDSVRPQDDFFQYVNGKWLESHPIPESETRWGTFNILRDEAWRAMRTIYQDIQTLTPEVGSIEQQARDFYFSGMHFNEFDATHRQLVLAMYQDIDAIETTKELSHVIGLLHSRDISGPWQTYIDSDHEDSSKHVFSFRQSGITLPNRDYYLDDSSKMQEIRKAYQIHAQKVYEQFPALSEDSSTFWDTLISFETALATISRSSADLRDVEKNYNKMSFDMVIKTYPAIDWLAYADGLGWRPTDQISIEQPEFFAAINDAFVSRSLDEWKLYLKWRVTSQCLSKINSSLAQLHFEFFGKTLSGTTEIMPLWKRVVLAAEYTIGEGTGRLYVERYFPESSKKQVLSLVDALREAYDERLQQLDWMSPATKEHARKKLANMKVLIGYPDAWRDFSGLSITRSSYLGNILAAQAYEVAYWLERLHEPTSREEWFMTPQTVNAYHDPNRLVICFPAGILQKPFFDPTTALAINMGGIGTVIGHELTHGFDDQGCMFDAEGNVRTWQTQEERDAFTKKAQVIVDQADIFEVLPGLTLKGSLVLGESIADLGGLELALYALKKQLDDVTDKKLAIEQFLINYAYTECSSVREEKLREFTLTDPHPASEFRVNGMIRHVDDFYKAFDVTERDKLYLAPDKRARIW
jgi:predicted metalloendopeptidase